MFDLIVIGGGTAGVAAAYTAASKGLKTLLVEKKKILGGEMSGGLVVPMMDAGKSSINRDFFEKLVTEMSKISAQIEFQGNKGWFNPHLLPFVLDNMLKNAGVTLLYNTYPIDYQLHEKSLCIKSVRLCGKILSEYNYSIHSDNILPKNISFTCSMLSEYIETRYIIDATGNCEFGKILNCNFLENKINENQLVSLRFCMGGVDVERLAVFLKAIDSDREVTPIEVIEGKTHLSTAFTWDKKESWVLYPIFKKAVEAGDLTEQEANYFQIFTVAGSDGEIALNCPRYSELIDVFDEKIVNDTHECLYRSVFRLANFCKKYLKGFENAYISAIADGIGIRCSRRIKGKYVYTEADLKSSKTFDNPVLEANYPIDVHKKDGSIEKIEKSYQLPIESLMSADFDNFFVAGRCLSADFKAQSALRVQQSCFSMGEGVAKYIAQINP